MRMLIKPALGKLLAIALLSTLQACGLNEMQSDKYHMTGGIGSVMTAVEARTSALEQMAQIMDEAHIGAGSAGSDLKRDKQRLAETYNKVWQDRRTDVIVELDTRMVALTKTQDRIAKTARENIEGRRTSLSRREAEQMDAVLEKDVQLARAIEKAKVEFAIQVRTYNETLAIFPKSLTAKLMQEEPAVELTMRSESGDFAEDGKKRLKMVDAAIGSKR